jgi:hypothetical protein
MFPFIISNYRHISFLNTPLTLKNNTTQHKNNAPLFGTRRKPVLNKDLKKRILAFQDKLNCSTEALVAILTKGSHWSIPEEINIPEKLKGLENLLLDTHTVNSWREKDLKKELRNLKFIRFYDENIFKNNFDLQKTQEEFEKKHGRLKTRITKDWIKNYANNDYALLSFFKKHNSMHLDKSSKKQDNELSEREKYLLELYNTIFGTEITEKDALEWISNSKLNISA